jgi:hypothetical protein
MDREIFVYINIENSPVVVGRLWTRVCIPPHTM